MTRFLFNVDISAPVVMGICLCLSTSDGSYVEQLILLAVFKAGAVIQSTIIKIFVCIAGGPTLQS